MIATAALGLFGQVLGIFGKRGEAKQEALAAVAANMQRTWVDELIVVYWFWPSVVDQFGWHAPLLAQVAAITASSDLFQIQLGITAAVFGLNKIAGKG